MARRAFVVTGLGYGDEGKGTTTDWLSRRYKAHTVIRTGGAQALHRVVCPNGEEHVFSQFGSGTLRGAATHLSKEMVVDPHAILKEGEALIYEHGIRGVFEMMSVHEDALVITPFQAIVGRLRELMRGKQRHGSVGIGIGETVLDAQVLGDVSIRAKDLLYPVRLREKLQAIQRRKLAALEESADGVAIDLIPADLRARVRSEIAQLQSPETVQWAAERFADLLRRVRIVDTAYVAEQILEKEGTVVLEGSQGVLLDARYGFHPYTTKVRTVPAVALGILSECEYNGEVKSLGVLRAYQTRHGAGPFVSESNSLTEKLPDVSNKKHPWQGNFRVGHFDAVAARYAVTCAENTIDGLIVTCVDRVAPFRSFEVCNTYDAPSDVLTAGSFFEWDGNGIREITSRADDGGPKQLERQTRLGQLLTQCSPRITTALSVRENSEKDFNDLCATVIADLVGVPVMAVSTGETASDKKEI